MQTLLPHDLLSHSTGRLPHASAGLLVLCLLLLAPYTTWAAPTSRPAKTAAKQPTSPTVQHRLRRLRALRTHFERSKGLETVPPQKVLSFYRKLARLSPYVRIDKIGKGDSGRPIHAVRISWSDARSSAQLQDQVVLLANNGIHSGEACGIDASQMFARDLLIALEQESHLRRVVFVLIPVYNVGGHIRFHPHNRVNQNGPLKMGFRGNGRLYDLNRDFVKADSQNMRAFARIFHRWKPHIFIDNHSTNGADYQHAMTYTLSDRSDMPPSLKRFARKLLKPAIDRHMKRRGFPTVPYVLLKKHNDIRKGLIGFISPPRFSTGFTPLFNTLSVLSETHMLKSYAVRVRASYTLMNVLVAFAAKHTLALREARAKADQSVRKMKTFTLRWKRLPKTTPVPFLGYAYRKVLSPVTGTRILRYDRSQARRWVLPFYNHFQPNLQVRVPRAYIIPQQWRRVIARLRMNQIRMFRLQKPQTLQVEQYIITQATWRKRPYEGHLTLRKRKVYLRKRTLAYRKGDWIVPTAQSGAKYILQTLEPMGIDSFLTWNFFDTIFQQKEYFSTYLFAPKAAQLLARNPTLRRIFEARLRKEPAFAKNPRKRLQFIYQSSRYYEASHKVYPITRLHGALPAQK